MGLHAAHVKTVWGVSAIVCVSIIFFMTTYSQRYVYLNISQQSSSVVRLIPVSHVNWAGQDTDPQSCDSMLAEKNRHYVTKEDFRIQLIAAAPGSGSDWCFETIALITGLRTDSVYNHIHAKNIQQTVFSKGELPLYYKTHYPFLRIYGEADGYLNTHPQKVIVVIRNPLDAAFSEYIRQVISKRRNNEGDKSKYGQIRELMTQSDFLRNSSDGKVLPASEFDSFLNGFLIHWKRHHEYWMSEYEGEVMIVLYTDLVRDIDLFLPMASFFGYNYSSDKQSLQRYHCFLKNLEKTRLKKRPYIPFLDNSKDTLRSLLSNKIQESLTYVNRLYERKYNQTLWLK